MTESGYNFICIYSQYWSDCVISIIIILYSSIVKLNSCSYLQLQLMIIECSFDLQITGTVAVGKS